MGTVGGVVVSVCVWGGVWGLGVWVGWVGGGGARGRRPARIGATRARMGFMGKRVGCLSYGWGRVLIQKKWRDFRNCLRAVLLAALGHG